ncbi:MAG: CRTAC1 family protein [Thermoanaerobaculia bacterium]
MSGEHYFAEMMGGGGALFDADGDGDLDLYLVQGGMLPADGDVGDALFPPRHPLPFTDRLYRNELVPCGELRFTDVTEESGVAGIGAAQGSYGMGVTAGDFDNDGRVDLYVTAFGPNRLLRNVGGDGAIAFAEVTAEAGVDDLRWSVAAVFFDYDGDGWLDLYVGNYVDFTLGTHKRCYDAAGARDYCAPSAYRGVSDRLFRNRGGRGGRPSFEDVSLETGIGTVAGSGLGAVTADFDGDGRLDLYVANDGEPNYLWLNQADGRDDGPTFRDVALMAGAAVDEDGRPQASMGIDAGDADDDGDEDLFMSHLTGESNALFLNLGSGEFRDATAGSGLASPSLGSTGFGTAFLDYDNDGWLDLLVVNGAVKTIEALASLGDPYPLHQQKLLFHNLGGGRFEEVADRAGSVFELSEVGRGAAFGDVDNDGDTDFVAIANSGPARLLINRVGQDRSWVGLRLVRGDPGRDALGARVEVLRPSGKPSLWRRAHADGSYASANDPRVLVGLDDLEGEVGVRVRWPDGSAESWSGLATRRYHILRQGTGAGG